MSDDNNKRTPTKILSEAECERVLKFWFGDDFAFADDNNKTTDVQVESYKHKQTLWFRPSRDNDELVKAHFADLYEHVRTTTTTTTATTADEVTDVRESLALVVLLSQMSRFIHRGTPLMFATDSLALALASRLTVDDDSSCSTPLADIHKFFVCVCLVDSEELAESARGLRAMQALASANNNANFAKYYEKFERQHALLAEFGRYPHRNELLGRRSTLDELKHLARTKSGPLCRSVLAWPSPSEQQHKASKHNNNNNQQQQQKQANATPKRVLVLHGYRQNANKLMKRTRALAKALKSQCGGGGGVQLVYMNGTNAYGDMATQTDNASESQRVWYEPVETPANQTSTVVYQGIERSLDHIATELRTHGPYVGIVGFSQGAVLASLLLVKAASSGNVGLERAVRSLRFFVCISAFEPRCAEWRLERPLSIASLHIYGRRDQIVTPERSAEYARRCFVASETHEHQHGHFNPGAWPVDKLVAFINRAMAAAESVEIKAVDDGQPLVQSGGSLSANARLVYEHRATAETVRFVHYAPLVATQWAKELLANLDDTQPDALASQVKKNITTTNRSEDDVNDALLLVAVSLAMVKAKQQQEQAAIELFVDLFGQASSSIEPNCLRALFGLAELDAEKDRDDHEQQSDGWRRLVLLCDKSFERQQAQLYERLLAMFAEQLVVDLLRQSDSSSVQRVRSLVANDELVASANKIANPLATISQLSQHMPRVKSALDKRSRIAREIAHLLNPYKCNEEQDDEAATAKTNKFHSYNKYRQVVSALSRHVRDRPPPTTTSALAWDLSRLVVKDHQQQQQQQARHPPWLTTQQQKLSGAELAEAERRLLRAPFADAIVNPVAEPVDFALVDEMRPLYDWLQSSQRIAAAATMSESDLAFVKGTVTGDGRLDLCKQVVGPSGIGALLDAMRGTRAHVDRLLLGNNLVGDEGARLIAEFIRSAGRSPLRVWYIAGNDMTLFYQIEFQLLLKIFTLFKMALIDIVIYTTSEVHNCAVFSILIDSERF